MTEWWKDGENELVTIDNEIDRGLTVLCGHEYEPGKWEYAIVRWWHRSATLDTLIREGETVHDH